MQFVEIKAAEHTTQAAMVAPPPADTVVIKRIGEKKKLKKGP